MAWGNVYHVRIPCDCGAKLGITQMDVCCVASDVTPRATGAYSEFVVLRGVRPGVATQWDCVLAVQAIGTAIRLGWPKAVGKRESHS